MEHRPLHEIAADIRKDWSSRTKSGRVPFFADAYLRPMETLSHISQNYHLDSARSVVLYFLSNAVAYRGDNARRYKAELKAILEDKNVTTNT
jgi:hypothetical protein